MIKCSNFIRNLLKFLTGAEVQQIIFPIALLCILRGLWVILSRDANLENTGNSIATDCSDSCLIIRQMGEDNCEDSNQEFTQIRQILLKQEHQDTQLDCRAEY